MAYENGFVPEGSYAPAPLRDAKTEEKQKIRKMGLTVGISLIIMAAISRFWNVAVSYIVRIMNIPRAEAVNFLTNEGTQQLMQILFSVVCFTLPFIIVAKTTGFTVSEIVSLKKPYEKTAIPYLLIGVAFCGFANIATNYAGIIFESFGVEYEVTKNTLPEGVIGFIIYTVSTAIIPAMAEEFGCRGILFGILEKSGEGFAVICSAVLFGLLHGNFEQMPFAFLVGLVLGLIRVKTGSLYICMAVHFFNNMISVLVSYSRIWFTNSTYFLNIIYIIIISVNLFLGIIAVLMLEEKGPVNFKKSESEVTEKTKFIWFFTSPAIIIFTVAEFLGSVKYFI